MVFKSFRPRSFKVFLKGFFQVFKAHEKIMLDWVSRPSKLSWPNFPTAKHLTPPWVLKKSASKLFERFLPLPISSFRRWLWEQHNDLETFQEKVKQLTNGTSTVWQFDSCICLVWSWSQREEKNTRRSPPFSQWGMRVAKLAFFAKSKMLWVWKFENSFFLKIHFCLNENKIKKQKLYFLDLWCF